MLVVVENNRYAQSTPIKVNLAGSILKRVQSFDIDADDVESNDIAVLYPKFYDAINFVRTNKKPFVQIVNTYRLNAHSKGDDDRSEEEVKKWWEKEPLKYVETKISKDEVNQVKLSLEKRLKTIEKRVNDMEFGSIY